MKTIKAKFSCELTTHNLEELFSVEECFENRNSPKFLTQGLVVNSLYFFVESITAHWTLQNLLMKGVFI